MAADAQENQKWFIDHVDSIIQNLIAVHESDYDEYSATLRESDELLLKTRNQFWQIIAGLITVALALAALKILDNSPLLQILGILGILGLGWTAIVAFVRGVVLPRMDKVEEAYSSSRIQLLYLQSWFESTTLRLDPALTQSRLDLYYDFIRSAVASQYFVVLSSVITFEAEMKILKPGDALKPELQRVTSYVNRGYDLFTAKRAELQDANVFSEDLRRMLDPFETRYQHDQGVAKALTTGKPEA